MCSGILKPEVEEFLHRRGLKFYVKILSISTEISFGIIQNPFNSKPYLLGCKLSDTAALIFPLLFPVLLLLVFLPPI